MSNLLPDTGPEPCAAGPDHAPEVEPLRQRSTHLGALEVHRVLPVRGRRLIGPWCFFDRYGPLTFTAGKPMDVAPHPHIGLQTVSWLIEGEVVHNDSIGSECLIAPGRLSLMTAGRGIAHAEETPRENTGHLNGVQLWVALPDGVRQQTPSYQCTAELPVFEQSGGFATVFAGELAGRRSPGNTFSPMIGADIAVHPRSTLHLPLDPSFESGILLISGDANAEGTALQPDILYYVGGHRGELTLTSTTGARLILIGGAPFGETVLMWWNFVARTQEEIVEARRAWELHEWFGDVPRYQGPRLPAPALLGRPIPSRD